jgi:hypothetical protein
MLIGQRFALLPGNFPERFECVASSQPRTCTR